MNKTEWVDVKDDMPYNHKNLLLTYENDIYTEPVLIIDEFNCYDIATMEFKNNEWIWNYPVKVIYWMPIPEIPRELEDMIRE